MLYLFASRFQDTKECSIYPWMYASNVLTRWESDCRISVLRLIGEFQRSWFGVLLPKREIEILDRHRVQDSKNSSNALEPQLLTSQLAYGSVVQCHRFRAFNRNVSRRKRSQESSVFRSYSIEFRSKDLQHVRISYGLKLCCFSIGMVCLMGSRNIHGVGCMPLRGFVPS
jgi:hypothetical protein